MAEAAGLEETKQPGRVIVDVDLLDFQSDGITRLFFAQAWRLTLRQVTSLYENYCIWHGLVEKGRWMMSSKNFRIGPKIVCDGEADFKKAIKDINNSMRLLRPRRRKTHKSLHRTKISSILHIAVLSTLNRTMAEQRAKVELIKDAFSKRHQTFWRKIPTPCASGKFNLTTRRRTWLSLQKTSTTWAMSGTSSKESGQKPHSKKMADKALTMSATKSTSSRTKSMSLES